MRGIRSLSFLVAVAGFVLPGCVSADKYMTLEDEYQTVQDELQFTRDQLSRAEAALADGSVDSDELAATKALLAQAEADRRALAEKYGALEGQSKQLSAVGITMFNPGNGMVGYRGMSDVFFASGSDSLTSEGKKALDALVGILKGDDQPIRVSGHTDSDPVVKTKDKFPGGNLELGAKRAIAVSGYLIDKGIGADRVSIESYGQYQPVALGGNKDDKQKNRRVEIFVPMAKN